MFNNLSTVGKQKYKALNIVIVETGKFHRAFLAKAITDRRPYHKIKIVDNIEEVFSLIYREVPIDVVVFDLESDLDVDNISILKAILPEVAFIHWSNCKHPEIIEFLHSIEVNTFCLKDSTAPTLVKAIDSIATNPNILFVDERLNKCLPLLTS